MALAAKQYSVSYSIRRYLYRPETTVMWLYKHTHTDQSVLQVNFRCASFKRLYGSGWYRTSEDFHVPVFFTHYLAAMGIVDGEVVHHLGVYCCHGNYWGVVVRLISHWSLQRDGGTVVLHFNGNQWRTKTSCRDRGKIFSF